MDTNSIEDMTNITRVSTPYELTPLSFDIPYEFPRHFLPTVMKGMTHFFSFSLHINKPSNANDASHIDDSKIPLVLVACGSFSPVTYLHLRMFGKVHKLLFIDQFIC